MKKKWIIVVSSLFLFLLFIPSIIFVVWNSIFQNNFVFANAIYFALEKVFGENNDLLFKKWDFYYKMWMYDIAIDYYSQVNCKSDVVCQKLYHNMWNAYFKQSESKQEFDKIPFLQNAVSSYKSSLDTLFNKDTKENYDYVSKILNDLLKKKKQQEEQKKKEQEKKQQDEQKDDKNDQQKEQDNKEQTDQQKKDGEQKDDKNAQNQKQESESQDGKESQEWEKKDESNQKKETQKDGGNAQNILPKWDTINISDDDLQLLKKSLTTEEKKEIEDYIAGLKSEEKQNIEFNKPSQDRDVFDILLEDFWEKLWTNKDW